MKVAFAVSLLAMLVVTLPAPAAAHAAFDDCSSSTVASLKNRLVAENGTLLPLIISRDAVHFSICRERLEELAGLDLEAALAKSHVRERRDMSEEKQAGSSVGAAAKAACLATGPCKVEVYRRHDYEPPKSVPFSKSGGLPFAALLGHTGSAGHFEITAKAVEASIAAGVAWSSEAKAILQSASRDADFYEWGNPRAHAQTKNDPRMGTIEAADVPLAPREFEAWTVTYLKRAVAECAQGRPGDALYLLGYALHGIQDLAFHEGITNAEHSFRDNQENEGIDADSGKHYKEKMALANRASAGLLAGFSRYLRTRSPDCMTAMTRFNGSKWALDRSKLLGKEMDFGLGPYREYNKLSDIVRDAVYDGVPNTSLFIERRWLGSGKQAEIDQFVTRIIGGMQ